MASVHAVIEAVSLGISLLGVAVVCWGLVEALTGFVRSKLSHPAEGFRENLRLRQQLGSHLLLALEVFIAADIIISVVSPTWERVGILGAIVIIRTVLAFFLTREVASGAEAGPSGSC